MMPNTFRSDKEEISSERSRRTGNKGTVVDSLVFQFVRSGCDSGYIPSQNSGGNINTAHARSKSLLNLRWIVLSSKTTLKAVGS